MDFRRIHGLPPYVFAQVDQAKIAARRAGKDVVDLGFGNPDVPSPPFVVDKMAEAVRKSKNHRYSASRGLPNLRKAIADLYGRRFGVDLDPETQVVATIGSKEGLSHLLWTLVDKEDTTVAPEPSYPIHLYAPVLAGSDVVRVPVTSESEYFERLEDVFRSSRPKPRVIIVSFPHNPTTTCVDLPFFERLVEFAHRHGAFLVHDFAYAETYFDDYRPPSLLQVEGAHEVGVELYSLTKGHSMAGWRMAFVLGNAPAVAALTKLKSYLDYGTFQPIQIASIVAVNLGDRYVEEVRAIYAERRDALVDGLNNSGWKMPAPRGTMFVWAPIPESYLEMGSVDFALFLLREANVAVSPGIGFGPGGDQHVRFALVENRHRISQAVTNIRRTLELA